MDLQTGLARRCLSLFPSENKPTLGPRFCAAINQYSARSGLGRAYQGRNIAMTRQSRRARLSKWLFNAVSKPAAQLRPRLRLASCGMIDTLEPRRMLATFTATSGADTITLYTSAGVPHVVINGNDQATTDTSIRVNCGSGDDTINMFDCAPGTVVDLGGGWNKVYYGGNSHVLFGTLPAATVIGSASTTSPDDDEIHFDDSGGG